MSYRFTCAETIAAGIHRIAGERARSAVVALGQVAAGQRRRRGVHRARKDIKQLRALLHLVRTPLGPAYKRENDALREIAHCLSPVRDVQVAEQTLGKLQCAPYVALDNETAERLQRQLERLRHDTMTELDLGERAHQAGAAMEEFARRAANWELPGDHAFAALAPGLTRSYKRGRKALAALDHTDDPACVHEWRKQAKMLWYQLRLLREAWHPVFGAMAKELSRLSDQLGEHHDCAELAQRDRSARNPATAR
ncbi:MAG: CHAD domain-containing protein [Planctomycetota bacterium]